jgi:hypothetical protein
MGFESGERGRMTGKTVGGIEEEKRTVDTLYRQI